MQTIKNHILKVVKSYMYDPDASDFQNNTNITNYRYDHIGNLVTDLGDSIKQITWTVSGKIKSITRDSISTKPDLGFDYDATGNRIAKHVYLKNDDKTINTAQSSHTYYIRDAQGNIMATYNHIGTSTLDLQEQPIYGSSRIGEYKPQGDSIGIVRGTRMYEETNHLGNVLVVFSDRKIPSFLNNDTTYRVHIADANDYYPFGMEMSGRRLIVKKEEDKYRFGFNGKEKEMEIGSGISDFGARMYNAQIGRWFTPDPQKEKYPDLSPFCAFANNPNIFVDPGGETLQVADNLQSKTDILSLIPTSADSYYRSQIKILNDGTVSMSADLMSAMESGMPDPEGSSGVRLLYNLITAKESYLYSASDAAYEQNKNTGEIKERDISNTKQGILNSSTTKNAPDYRSDPSWNPITETMKSNSSVMVPISLEGGQTQKYDGIVTISPTKSWMDNGKVKPRSSVIFHELWENYERTTNKKPYDIPLFTPKGNSMWNGGADYTYDRKYNSNSAHDRSANAESNYYEMSENPGCVDQ